MEEILQQLTLPAPQWRRIITALMAAAWNEAPALAELPAAACDLFAAYCHARGADPAAIAASLPYSVDLHAKLNNVAHIGLSPVDGEALDA